MGQNDITYAMIASAVKKGLRDIRENPGRGIRNLVDLGGMFADGRFQKEFFHTAIEQLENENSMYYRLVEQVVRDTDADILTTFGMNLGYNSWTVGARTIRQVEGEQGFNVPWCILFDLGYEQYLELDAMRSLIRQGKELGIYAYLLYVEEEYPHWNDLMALLREEQDCAFLLFLHPGVITAPFVEELMSTRTIWASIDLDAADTKQIARASALLLESRCLCGGFAQYTDWEREAEPRLSATEALGLPFLTLLGAKKHHLGSPDGEEKLLALRKNPALPVFPIELYRDMARIDQNISTEACLTAVLGDGSVLTTSAEEVDVQTGCNIKDTPLREILRKTMPKKKRSTPA